MSENPQPTIDSSITREDLKGLFKNWKNQQAHHHQDAILDTGMHYSLQMEQNRIQTTATTPLQIKSCLFMQTS
jgi:hypothetical protein